MKHVWLIELELLSALFDSDMLGFAKALEKKMELLKDFALTVDEVPQARRAGRFTRTTSDCLTQGSPALFADPRGVHQWHLSAQRVGLGTQKRSVSEALLKDTQEPQLGHRRFGSHGMSMDWKASCVCMCSEPFCMTLCSVLLPQLRWLVSQSLQSCEWKLSAKLFVKCLAIKIY